MKCERVSFEETDRTIQSFSASQKALVGLLSTSASDSLFGALLVKY